jgi:hypothetical protein
MLGDARDLVRLVACYRRLPGDRFIPSRPRLPGEFDHSVPPHTTGGSLRLVYYSRSTPVSTSAYTDARMMIPITIGPVNLR